MKIRISLIHLAILLFFFGAKTTIAQELSSKQKKEWKIELRSMEESDQYYRVKMIEHPELDNDSTWRLQSISDSINRAKFIQLTSKYGYPSKKNIGKEASIALILHFTLEPDFLELKDLFKAELTLGNMLPSYYAWWYDRCQRNMNKPIYFGQYTNDDFCGEQLALFNQRRKEIGLEELDPNPNCD